MNAALAQDKRTTNIALILTASRLVLSPIFVFVYMQQTYWTALACLGIAILSELTDLFDGMVARARNEVTNLGKILDPMADSISRLTVFLCFVWGGQAPLYLIIFILYRDSMIATLRTFCAYRGVVVSARKSGKLKAVVQATVILIILLLRTLSYKIQPEMAETFLTVSHVLIWIVTLVTVLSAFDYLQGNWRVLREALAKE
jgi:CDP-diacylglycerol--glycerol-3-phosphate 3-phosphatidyltransferase